MYLDFELVRNFQFSSEDLRSTATAAADAYTDVTSGDELNLMIA
jgi:hypothetical protein